LGFEGIALPDEPDRRSNVYCMIRPEEKLSSVNDSAPLSSRRARWVQATPKGHRQKVSGNADMLESELSDAVSKGDLQSIRALLDAGADIRYTRPKGYTVMIDVMHGRSISSDEQLLPVLRLLIDRGAALDAVSDYGESALSVASNVGRFDGKVCRFDGNDELYEDNMRTYVLDLASMVWR
jgi:hypothetical protein